MDEKRNNRAVERKLSDCLRQDRARIQVGRISHFGLLEMSRQRIRASVLESSTEPCSQCGGSGHVRSVSSVALQLLRGIEEILMKGATHNLVVRTRTDVALYVLNHKRGHLRDLENAFKVSLAVVADATVSGQQSFIIDRGEQVHTLEAAKALLAAQAAASPPQVDEPYDDEEPFDIEAEIETEETEGLTDDAAASGEEAAGEGEGDGHRRKRRRRRRGRGEPREGGAPREDNETLRVVAEAMERRVADDGEADEEEADEVPVSRSAARRSGTKRRASPTPPWTPWRTPPAWHWRTARPEGNGWKNAPKTVSSARSPMNSDRHRLRKRPTRLPISTAARQSPRRRWFSPSRFRNRRTVSARGPCAAARTGRQRTRAHG